MGQLRYSRFLRTFDSLVYDVRRGECGDRLDHGEDPASGIRNDPNTYFQDPRYIVDLLKRVVRVSVESVEIIRGLPPLGV